MFLLLNNNIVGAGRGQRSDRGSKARGYRAWPLGCIRLAPLSCRLAPPPPATALPLYYEVNEFPGAQAEVDGEIVRIGGAKCGNIGCSRWGMGEYDFEGLMCVVLLKLVFKNI